MIKPFYSWTTTEEQDKIQETINSARWAFGHGSTPQATGNFWHLIVDPSEDFYYKHLLNKIKETTGDNLEIERVYFNGHQNSSSGDIHRDHEAANARTFLIYCNTDWSPEHGGHTHFLNEGQIMSIPPVPYSAVYFNGTIDHFAAPISPTYTGLRVTLAFKLFKKD